MKRSAVNEVLREGEAFMRSHGVVLPPFARWSPDTLRERCASDSPQIRERRLGWDITDYGQGAWEALGLLLFTARNGSPDHVRNGRGMLYAEKIMISGEGQVSPMHRHNLKTEDIINRGGAALVLELYMTGEDGGIDGGAEVRVVADGVERRLPAGGRLRLLPGESVTLEPNVWHAFWGEGGRALIGEVSNVNDDLTDNVFRDPVGRFSEIDEDEPPLRLLVSDYDRQLV